MATDDRRLDFFSKYLTTEVPVMLSLVAIMKAKRSRFAFGPSRSK